MSVRLHVQNSKQIVVPVRFTRAVTGPPVAASPDLDDRGFAMPRPANFNPTDARGPMVGITVGDTVTLKVVLEDIDGTAPLFVTLGASTAPQLQMVFPTSGNPLPADGLFKIKGTADTTKGQTVEVRLGSKDGPVLGELEPHVFSPLTLNVTPHLCRIHSTLGPVVGAGVAPAVDVDRLFELALAIWKPAGIRFNVGGTQTTDYFGFARDNQVLRVPLGGANSVASILAQGRVNNTCNVYFVRFMDSALGIGLNRDTMATENSTNPGVVVAVDGLADAAGTVTFTRPSTGADLEQELANDLAHELGHFMKLRHAGAVNAPGLSDTFARRQLMHPHNLLPSVGAGNPNIRFNDIGYGTVGVQGHRGCLITLKKYSTHPTDSDTRTARDLVKAPNNVKY